MASLTRINIGRLVWPRLVLRDALRLGVLNLYSDMFIHGSTSVIQL
jgi:hypothetical protein